MAQSVGMNITGQEEDTLKGKYLIFSMSNEMYGIEIRHITEIIGVQPITEIPEMPQYVKGVTNLRGKIIPVIDARLRFKKSAREYDGKTCIIIIDIKQISIGLIVDNVSEVLKLDDEDIAPTPSIHKTENKFVKGIGKVGKSVILLLDCQNLLSDDEWVSLSDVS
jgi:purine-binding chemotaxis protein CheW